MLVLLATLLGELLILTAGDILHQRHHSAQAIGDLLGEEDVGVVERIDQPVEAGGEQRRAHVELPRNHAQQPVDETRLGWG